MPSLPVPGASNCLFRSGCQGDDNCLPCPSRPLRAPPQPSPASSLLPAPHPPIPTRGALGLPFAAGHLLGGRGAAPRPPPPRRFSAALPPCRLPALRARPGPAALLRARAGTSPVAPRLGAQPPPPAAGAAPAPSRPAGGKCPGAELAVRVPATAAGSEWLRALWKSCVLTG